MRKTPKCQNTFQSSKKKNIKKPFELPQEQTSSPLENGGDPLKKMKIPKNCPKFQVIQPYITFRTWN